MGEYLKKVSTQILTFLKQLSPGRKIALVGTSIVVVVGMVAMAMWAGQTTFSPLMTNLSPEDSKNVQRFLSDKHIPFRVDSTGKNVMVPPESLYDLRLELATQGYPQSSVVGYEVFDKTTLGTTSFVQKVNQKRALEGELMRTINTIRGVKRSRVHLALPQKSAFVEDQKKPTASVVLDLDPGVLLNEKQVFGIANLVARAIEGMDVSDVGIVDSNGKTLSKNNGDALSAATATQLEFQEKYEGELEKRIEAMLARVVGEGHVAAKVNADLDFSQVNETQTTYDADGSAMMSVEKRTDSMNAARPGAQGVPGAQSNTPGITPAGSSDVKTETNKNNEVINYKVPQTVRQMTKPSGTVKRLSVAVMVDGKSVKTVNKDGTTTVKNEAWAPDKLKEFEDIVATAAGIDKKRGDLLEIRTMEFTHEDFEEAQKIVAEKERKAYIQNMIIYAVIGLTVAMFFLFVVRPFIKWVTENTIDSVDTFLPQTIEELEKLQKNAALPGLEDTVPQLPDRMDPEKVEGEMIKEKIITLVDGNPHKAALILKDWLHDPHGKKLAGDKEAEAGGGGGKGKAAG